MNYDNQPLLPVIQQIKKDVFGIEDDSQRFKLKTFIGNIEYITPGEFRFGWNEIYMDDGSIPTKLFFTPNPYLSQDIDPQYPKFIEDDYKGIIKLIADIENEKIEVRGSIPFTPFKNERYKYLAYNPVRNDYRIMWKIMRDDVQDLINLKTRNYYPYSCYFTPSEIEEEVAVFEQYVKNLLR